MHPLLNTAVKAARRAGAVINRASLDLDRVEVDSKGPHDFVTDIDRAAEAEIIEVLRTAYPSHGILAEESGDLPGSEFDDEGRPSHQWIIDPIDGTTNFIHGYPQYAVSIALAQHGRITQAVIYDPNRNELFTATRGSGAFIDGKRMRVTRRTRLHEGLVGIGFAPERGLSMRRLHQLMFNLNTQTAGMRRTGSSVLDLAHVAAGRLDGYIGVKLKPWDTAAGALLVQEAGGLVGNFEGEDGWLNGGEIVAATPRLFPMLLALAHDMRGADSTSAVAPADSAAPSSLPTASDLDSAPF